MEPLWQRSPTGMEDGWEDQPAQGWFYEWVLGVAVALVPVGWGIEVLVSGSVTLGRSPVTFRGGNAMAIGIAWIALGVFGHCHYFWGNLHNRGWVAVLGKIVSACALIGALGFLLVRNGVLGRG